MTNTNVFVGTVVVAAKVAVDTVVMDSKVVYTGAILGASVALGAGVEGMMNLNDKKEVLLNKMDNKFGTLADKLAAMNAKRDAQRAAKKVNNVVVGDFNGQAVA